MFTEALQLTSPDQQEYERRRRSTFLTFAVLIFSLIMTGALFFSREITCEIVTVIRKCDKDILVEKLVEKAL